MDRELARQHRLRNLLQTLLLIGGMALLLALSAELLFGDGVWPWVFGGVALALLLAPEVPPRMVLQLHRARPIAPWQAPELSRLVELLARRAGLEQTPSLWRVPSRQLNAFALGSRGQAAIAVTDGLLHDLDRRELAGVLAHEISHVANNDMWLMGLADMVGRLTHLLSSFALLLIFFALPLVLTGWVELSLSGLLLLVAAPTVSALLQLALSRTREFAADLDAAHLTGDPEGLARALLRLQQRSYSLWERLFHPGYRDPGSGLLRTHPPTRERVERLREIGRLPPPLPTMW